MMSKLVDFAKNFLKQDKAKPLTDFVNSLDDSDKEALRTALGVESPVEAVQAPDVPEPVATPDPAPEAVAEAPAQELGTAHAPANAEAVQTSLIERIEHNQITGPELIARIEDGTLNREVRNLYGPDAFGPAA